jgi:hypothetical protein
MKIIAALALTGLALFGTAPMAHADEPTDSENGIVFCGFEEGDISPEELAEMGVDETFTIEYKTQAECDAETEAALAEAANDPDVDSDLDLTDEPTEEPTDEPVVEDEVIETPIVDEPVIETVEPIAPRFGRPAPEM